MKYLDEVYIIQYHPRVAWTEPTLLSLCTFYIFLLKALMAIKVMSTFTPFLKLVFLKQNISFVALLRYWRDKKIKFVLTDCLFFGGHCGMVHCGIDGCLADNKYFSVTSLPRCPYKGSWSCANYRPN